ncbi:hypothetical protein [Cohnella sp. JJ-181]|uniref:hypothetical protein n=1 Tax=Cohnella rhizoplanae TaxID=2974897 RepID=UPI0022FFB0AC|nr:hypothetical protein [Cohnella sp. JJ-181]CAI6087149.1 hypothetical protein COHCIP112018_05354 [Cohnella sp. JJ-181]
MKRYVSILLLLSFAAVGLFSFPPAKAYACSCVARDTQEKLANAAAVFVGEVVHKGFPSFFRSGQTRAYTFEVKQAWKGVSTKRVTIQALDGGSDSCGTSFHRNQSYIVFAYYDKNQKLQTNLCSGNLKATTEESIAILGKASMEGDDLKGGAHGLGTPSFNRFLYISALLLVAAATIMTWKTYRRKRRS